jgi:hypothetical protein
MVITIGVPVSSGTIYCAVPIPRILSPDAMPCKVVCWIGLIEVRKSTWHGETPMLAPVSKIRVAELDNTCLRSMLLCKASRVVEGTVACATDAIGGYCVGMMGTCWAEHIARAW